MQMITTFLMFDGPVFLEFGSYGLSNGFGWLADGFGVSWQLNLR